MKAFTKLALAVSVALAWPAIAAAQESVSVDPTIQGYAINPDIYGVNFGDPAQANYMHWPVQRWGGNSTTRYNWMTDVQNLASDWYFENYPQATPNPGTLPNGSTADIFVSDAFAAGGQPLLTLGDIGWTPKETLPQPPQGGPSHWGFSVGTYGAQCSADPFQTDAGNGVLTDCATNLTGNAPSDTSTAVDQTWAASWMAHLQSQFGLAGSGGVKYYALDNEPMLWNSTHRDVHPSPTTYDEMWSKAQAWGAAIKTQDSGAQVFAPSEWGWCGYFWSALDGCPGNCPDAATCPDYFAHSQTYFTDWYLQQAHNYDTNNGVRLIDYLDMHFYPQEANVALSDAEDATTSALRLRSLKGLYDPTYVDESWIGTAGFEGGIIRMIPRMHDWVNTNYPGTKLAISEYNWGNDNGASSALAQAEALAIFGREGLDLATRWVAPAAGSFVEDAFKLYLDYDGISSRVTGTSVQATSSNVDAVGSYAVENVSNRLFMLLFDKNTAATGVTVSRPTASGFTQPGHLFGFDQANRLADLGIVNPAGGNFSLTMPARAAWLLIEQLDFNDVPPSNPFYNFVMKLANNSITAGCGAGNFCPLSNIIRSQMAVFVLRSAHGPVYVPPAANCAAYPFSDVVCPNPFADFILEAYNEGIMGVGEDVSCGAGMFCPADAVTRLSMAYILLRGQWGGAYAPPAANCATFPFTDVACPSTDANWVAQLYGEGITAGCTATLYCPANDLTRSQMAVFLVATFGLP